MGDEALARGNIIRLERLAKQLKRGTPEYIANVKEQNALKAQWGMQEFITPVEDEEPTPGLKVDETITPVDEARPWTVKTIFLGSILTLFASVLIWQIKKSESSGY